MSKIPTQKRRMLENGNWVGDYTCYLDQRTDKVKATDKKSVAAPYVCEISVINAPNIDVEKECLNRELKKVQNQCVWIHGYCTQRTLSVNPYGVYAKEKDLQKYKRIVNDRGASLIFKEFSDRYHMSLTHGGKTIAMFKASKNDEDLDMKFAAFKERCINNLLSSVELFSEPIKMNAISDENLSNYFE